MTTDIKQQALDIIQGLLDKGHISAKQSMILMQAMCNCEQKDGFKNLMTNPLSTVDNGQTNINTIYC